MNTIEWFFTNISHLLPLAIAIAIISLILFLTRTLMEKRYSGSSDQRFKIQLVMLFLSFIGLLIIIIVAPLSDSQQGQLLSLIGILLSAAIALSSTTFVGNAMAGMMLRAVRSFKAGDFIRVGDYFGRVTERGLFHIEIQTEDRDLTTLPNLFLVTNPVKVTSSSGTVVTAEVSLGYDVSRNKIKELLQEAALAAELNDPFVHVISLGDFSVTYRVAGMLLEVKQLITVRSRLREMMLDKLHEAGIEIVSPNFMNTRSLASEVQFIPRKEKTKRTETKPQQDTVLEELVFDKAEEAESLEKLQQRYALLGESLKDLKEKIKQTEAEMEKSKLTKECEQIELRRERLLEYIKNRKEENKK